jgi:MinD superfamily P-loop ATPase
MKVAKRRKNPKRQAAARRVIAQRRADDHAVAGRIHTEPCPACPVCTSACRIDHDREGYSFAVCHTCGASNRKDHTAG